MPLFPALSAVVRPWGRLSGPAGTPLAEILLKKPLLLRKGDLMTIGNALTFIERGIADCGLRERLNAAVSTAELDNVLTEEKILFSAPEFEEAFRHRLTQCQEIEEADQLKEFKQWWDLLVRIIEPAACGNQCSGCCQ
jgi:hypothetical protein